MKNIRTLYIVILVASGFLYSCTTGFDELQNSPNRPAVINPGSVLEHTIYYSVNSDVNTAFSLGLGLMQYASSNNTAIQIDRYLLTDGQVTNLWDGCYNRMANLRDVEDLAKKMGNGNYEAVAIILQTWLFSIVTDAFGDAPYFQSGMAYFEEIYSPRYDRQEEIYLDMINRLDHANGIIDVPEGLVFGGDNLFSGNMTLWKKFGNSLRLRLLIRMSKKNQAYAAAKIAAIVADPVMYPLVTGNAEQVEFRYSGVSPVVFPMSNQTVAVFNRYRPSAFIVDKFKFLNDPRLKIYFSPTPASLSTSNPQYVGLPSGLEFGDAATYNGGPNYVSTLNHSLFRTNPAQRGIILTYAEVQFNLAEAALRGMITADPVLHYENGIRASLQYWGTSADNINQYLAEPDIQLNGDINKIHLQKYFALFFCGLEAWFEYKRTGQPVIVPGPANVNDNRVPMRLMYPAREQAVNRINYEEAVRRIGSDDINIKVWWQP